PGVVPHASNILEHPELTAERITRFAKLVGRENVIAGSDCGFSSQATYNPEVHPNVVWDKFHVMAGGPPPRTQATLALIKLCSLVSFRILDAKKPGTVVAVPSFRSLYCYS